MNRHICSVADGYVKDGFLAVAPALYDRIQRGVELDRHINSEDLFRTPAFPAFLICTARSSNSCRCSECIVQMRE